MVARIRSIFEKIVAPCKPAVSDITVRHDYLVERSVVPARFPITSHSMCYAAVVDSLEW